MKSCHFCLNPAVQPILDLGPQPICNRFLHSADAGEFTHPMVIGVCEHCGLVQISEPVPAVELAPRFDWITYNEPERHLDQLVEFVVRLPGVSKNSVVAGVSFKDDTTLGRMQRSGFNRTWRIDLETDLKVERRGAGVETIQDRLTPEIAGAIAHKYGAADIVFARHILEHTHRPKEFMAALRNLTRRNGYVVFELPDCQRALENGDYSTIWEEHTMYFTPETFRSGLAFGGFQSVHFESEPYPLENCLIAVVRAQGHSASVEPAAAVEQERTRALAFARSLVDAQKKFADYFTGFRRHGKVAVFGAGHLACAFINFLGLKEHIEFVVDDNPNKRGLFMPGSRLPIVGSSALVEHQIKLCLLCLSPESEEKVIQKNQAFVEQGGKFASIFPASKHALVIQ